MKGRILVDREAFAELLTVLQGPDYMVRELIAIARIGAGPLPQLYKDLEAANAVRR